MAGGFLAPLWFLGLGAGREVVPDLTSLQPEWCITALVPGPYTLAAVASTGHALQAGALSPLLVAAAGVPQVRLVTAVGERAT